MKQKKQNRRRVCRAMLALSAGGYTKGNDPETAATDLVGDLMHLCKAIDADFPNVLRVALMHFVAETRGDDIEPTADPGPAPTDLDLRLALVEALVPDA